MELSQVRIPGEPGCAEDHRQDPDKWWTFEKSSVWNKILAAIRLLHLISPGLAGAGSNWLVLARNHTSQSVPIPLGSVSEIVVQMRAME